MCDPLPTIEGYHTPYSAINLSFRDRDACQGTAHRNGNEMTDDTMQKFSRGGINCHGRCQLTPIGVPGGMKCPLRVTPSGGDSLGKGVTIENILIVSRMTCMEHEQCTPQMRLNIKSILAMSVLKREICICILVYYFEHTYVLKGTHTHTHAHTHTHTHTRTHTQLLFLHALCIVFMQSYLLSVF